MPVRVKEGGHGDRSQSHFQIKGFSLTTAEILYRMPDHPGLLQSFLWQGNIDGQLYRVKVANKKLISPAEFSFIDGQFALH